jgi:hypothetical protein
LDLPCDLIDVIFRPEMLRVVTRVLARVEPLLVEQGEGMMIACVPPEETCARRFGDEKAEEIEIEAPAGLEVRSIEAKMAKSPNLKRPIQGNAANVVFFFGRCRHESLSCYDTLTQSMSALQLIWLSSTAGNSTNPLQDADTTA